MSRRTLAALPALASLARAAIEPLPAWRSFAAWQIAAV